MTSLKQPLPRLVFTNTVRTWFVIAFIGQLIFAVYIILLYGGAAITQDLDRWNAAAPHAMEEGSTMGNLGFAVHVLMAAIITILGPLQLIPDVRAKAPRFHRISGRVYIGAAFLTSIVGLLLVWLKGTVGGTVGHIFVSLNAIIIMTCAWFAITTARRRQFALHRQWAIRLFLAMSGVWMFRIFLMMWLMLHGAPVGFDPETFTGPFLTCLYVSVYVLPIAIAEWYLRTSTSKQTAQQWGFSLFLAILTIGMSIGIFAATMGMWLPRI